MDGLLQWKIATDEDLEIYGWEESYLFDELRSLRGDVNAFGDGEYIFPSFSIFI